MVLTIDTDKKEILVESAQYDELQKFMEAHPEYKSYQIRSKTYTLFQPQKVAPSPKIDNPFPKWQEPMYFNDHNTVPHRLFEVTCDVGN